MYFPGAITSGNPLLPTNNVAGVVGGQFAAQLATAKQLSKPAPKRVPGTKRQEDEVIIAAPAVQEKPSLHNLSENSQEDAHEDRQERGSEPAHKDHQPPTLDVSG